MKKIACVIAVLGALGGCATVEGIGRDISAASRTIADAF
ncbi:MAG: entericidin EcnA/B family protein [Pseudomonadota bacterium]